MTDVLTGLARTVPAGVLVGLPVLLPLLGAALALLLRRAGTQRAIPLLVLPVMALDAAALLLRADADGPLAVQAGNWDAPFGISLVADRLSSLLTLVSVIVLMVVLVYAIGQGVADAADERSDRVRVVFHPAYLVLASGVSFSFLTGDLFNLFVAFEVMLTASYVLITLQAGPSAVRSAMTYIVVSLLASVLFVTVIGLVYAATGTVNMADLRGALAEVPGGVRLSLALLLIVVFGIKAALFPLYFWLPDSYPVAPAPVTAVFAGLLTKVGVYAIIRTQTLIFPDDTAVTGPVLLVLAGATLLVGILGAIAQNEIKRVLSFTIVSHIGFIVMGLAFFTVAGVAGAVLYMVHHIVIQTTLFCVEGLIERRTGTSRLDRISGLTHRSALLGVLFALPALSLAGIPPFSGFLAKLALLQAGSAVGSWVIVGLAVLVSLLTLYSMALIWGSAFWGSPSDVVPDEDPEDAVQVGVRTVPATMTAATAAVVLVGLAIPVLGGPLYALCLRAAADLLAAGPYVEAVLG
ncbi:multicomponent Na+:H+ antiporter subunit D [Kineococcus xinjiangensis]|uniref:Multicomponent Na+:H+ antiporter subunit D n=1 Tax=Kineococcus xinjiangensis TaxID=512762 RepID=A0A2S6IGS4_9ACTN|nr:Na+/H+ antiporter subunit D [Kineococcus xinjiangensis]PPK93413.1 multicomponent Na+:H+ antiporter subunit D [Kineococcus xinjiangensis]